jgi:hypothetical protein
MPTNTILITDKCSQVINTPGVQITSIEGRERGRQINFLNYVNIHRQASMTEQDKLFWRDIIASIYSKLL